MWRNPGLWRYAIVPIALNLLVTGLVFGLIAWGAVAFGAYLHPHFEGGWWWRVAEVLAGLAIAAASLGLTVVGWFLFQAVLCGFFYARLARQVERQLGARPEELRELSFVREVSDGLRQVLSFVAVNVGLLCLHLIPVVGAVAAFGGGLYFDCWFFGREFLQIPLAVRGQGRDQLKAFTRKHRRVTLGLGAATLLLTFIPILNAVLLTTATTGAVLLRRRLTEATDATPPAGEPPSSQPRT